VTALLLIAFALGIDNFAVSIGIGVSGVRGRLRLRVALVFGLFEAGMPVLGMLAGHAAAGWLGSTARWTGGGLLVAVGCYQLIEWYRERRAPRDHAPSGSPAAGTWGLWRLLASGLALSIDNLVVGFALGAYHVTLATAALVIALVSVALSLAGLELGAKLGTRFGEHSEMAGGIVLAAVGILMAAGVFLPAVHTCRLYWPGRGGKLPFSSRSNSPSLTPSTNASHSASVKYSFPASGFAASNIT
jgi:putative Mn2+ efflux pump MntP